MPRKPKAATARLAAVALCATLLLACRAQQSEDVGEENQAVDKAPPQRLPIVEPPFDRARLLLAAARAASAHSAGINDVGVQRSLDGKQFELRLRFGCEGPGPGDGGYGWSLDPDGRTLRLRAEPTLSLNDEATKKVAGDRVEAVEGFWLPRPWLLHAACPGRSPTTASASPTGDPDKQPEQTAKTSPQSGATLQRIGIAQFFTTEDARTGRRMNRPFEAVKQLVEGERVGQDGFDLVLSGRLRARDGRVILCSGSGVDRPPDCILSAAIDRAWIEKPENKEVLAEWRM